MADQAPSALSVLETAKDQKGVKAAINNDDRISELRIEGVRRASTFLQNYDWSVFAEDFYST